MKSFVASLMILFIVLFLVWINFGYLYGEVERLSKMEEEILRDEKEFRKETNKDLILKSLEIFEKNQVLFRLSYKKSEVDIPKNSLEKLLVLIQEENFSDYLMELQEYSFSIKKLQKDSSLNWDFVF